MGPVKGWKALRLEWDSNEMTLSKMRTKGKRYIQDHQLTVKTLQPRGVQLFRTPETRIVTIVKFEGLFESMKLSDEAF